MQTFSDDRRGHSYHAMKLLKYITRKTVIFILLTIAVVYGGILWDLQRLDKNFNQLYLLLRTARVDALYMKTTVIVRFNGNTVTVTNQKDSRNITTAIPMIARVDYDTVMGKGMIVYDWRGTGAAQQHTTKGFMAVKSC